MDIDKLLSSPPPLSLSLSLCHTHYCTRPQTYKRIYINKYLLISSSQIKLSIIYIFEMTIIYIYIYRNVNISVYIYICLCVCVCVCVWVCVRERESVGIYICVCVLCYSKTDAQFMQDAPKSVWSIPLHFCGTFSKFKTEFYCISFF